MQSVVPQSGYRFSAGQCWKRMPLNDDLMPIEDIKFGYACVRAASESVACRLPAMNSYVGVLTADMVSGGTATLTGKIVDSDGNETAIALSQAFSADQATTAGLIKDYLENLDSDLTCTLSNSNRTFTVVVGGDKRLVITAGFARSGTGTATFTNTKGTTDAVRGVASRDPNAPTVLDYSYEEPYHRKRQTLIGVTFQGDPAVPVAGTPAAGGAVYALLEDYTDSGSVLNPRGSFRTDTDSGAAPVVLVSDAEFAYAKDNGLAPVSMNKV